MISTEIHLPDELNFSASASHPLFAMLSSAIFHISFHSLFNFMKRILPHLHTECLQAVTTIHPSLFLVIIQGFTISDTYPYYSQLFKYIFETCFQGLAINPKTWKNFGSRIYSEYLSCIHGKMHKATK